MRGITRRGSVTAAAAVSQQQQGQGQAGGKNSSQQGEEGQGGGWRAEGQHVGEGQGPVTAIWVTHRFEELEFADAATYMQDGRVVFMGTPAEMIVFLRKEGARV